MNFSEVVTWLAGLGLLSLAQYLLHDLPRSFDNSYVFPLMKSLYEALPVMPVALLKMDLIYHDRCTSIDGFNHVVDHETCFRECSRVRLMLGM
jgi:hypothetical protein